MRPEDVSDNWMMPKDKYEKLVAHVRPEAEKVARILQDGGYISNAESWMGNWENTWQSNLNNCQADGICHLKLS